MTINTSGDSITGNHNRITGYGNTITGNHNSVIGDNNIVTGNHNKVSGNHNQGTGNHNTASGTGNQWNGSFNKVEGQVMADAKKSNTSFSISDEGGTIIISGGDGNIQYGGDLVIRSGPQQSVIQRFYNGPVQSTEKKSKKEEEEDEIAFIECPLESDKDVAIAEDAPDGTPACVICLSNVPLCVLLPCMHKCICCGCGRQVTGDGLKRRGQVECPLCKKKVERVARVFDN